MKSLRSGFSILIPSWNNLPFLQLCISSIRQHSAIPHEIIVFVNEGTDGTIPFLNETGIRYMVSDHNVGVCVSLNRASQMAGKEWFVYLNDDMYVLPGWDIALAEAAENADSKIFLFSGTMIEPSESGNKCVIVTDYGDSPKNFAEEKLLAEYALIPKKDWNGSSWPPILVHRDVWNAVGGYSEEFSPGMSSDPDFSMKLWKTGVRNFRGVANSRVYHFQAKSTGRIKKNNGRKQFLEKWGITQSVFYRYFLRMGTPYEGVLGEPKQSSGYSWGIVRSKIKRLLSSFSSTNP